MTTYKKAGVDIEAGNMLVKRLKKISPDIGGFSGLFPTGRGNFLAASTDGVGTKLKIAQLSGKHDTVGIDLVAMCVNDIITVGAKPLFFLDYFATGKLNVDLAEKVIKGIARGCREAGCVLLGGETAEMPGFYTSGEYDLAGFCVGSVTKNDIIKTSAIKPGDAIIGLASSGVHSNGFSLVRKVFKEKKLKALSKELLKPTKIYVKDVFSAMKVANIKGMAHITGGGFIDNIPRILPSNCAAVINKNSWHILPIFEKIQQEGKITDQEMFRTFNMGIGMVIVVHQQDAYKILRRLPKAKVIGRIIKGKQQVSFQ
ncbi:MAG: phosphoribosylformylglycinamidine cyclo-ligase [bacterium]